MTTKELKFSPVINEYENKRHKQLRKVFDRQVLPIFVREGLQVRDAVHDAVLDARKDWKVDFLRYQGYAGYAHGYLVGCFWKMKRPKMNLYRKLLKFDKNFNVSDIDQLFGCCQHGPSSFIDLFSSSMPEVNTVEHSGMTLFEIALHRLEKRPNDETIADDTISKLTQLSGPEQKRFDKVKPEHMYNVLLRAFTARSNRVQKWIYENGPSTFDSNYQRVKEIHITTFGLLKEPIKPIRFLEKLKFAGYTEDFLQKCKVNQTGLVSAFLQIVEIDIQEEKSLAELVFGCCKGMPNKKFIKKFNLEEDETKLIEVLSYTDEEKSSLFAICFNRLNGPDKRNAAMLRNVQDLFFHFVDLINNSSEATQQVFLKALESPSKAGLTAFSSAASHSEKISDYILNQDVQVNTVDAMGQVPTYQFSNNLDRMVAKRVHPHAKNWNSKSQLDYYGEMMRSIKENLRIFSKSYYTTIENQDDPRLPKPFFTKDGVYFRRFSKTPLGGGAQGNTYVGEYMGKPAVFKFIKVDKVVSEKTTEAAMDNLRRRLNELYKLKAAEGQHVLPVFGHYRQQETVIRDGDEVTELFDVIITQRCETDLGSFLNYDVDTSPRTPFPKRKENVSDDILKEIIIQVLKGLKTVANAGLIHGDIKYSNILINQTDDRDDSTIQCYLGDFGYSGVQYAGTPGFSSLEKFSKEIVEKSDMYSMGLLCLYILAESYELFIILRDNTFLKSNLIDGIPAAVRSLPTLKLIKRMMEINPYDRIGIDDCIEEWKKFNSPRNPKLQRITRTLLKEHGIHDEDLKLRFSPRREDFSSYRHNRNKSITKAHIDLTLGQFPIDPHATNIFQNPIQPEGASQCWYRNITTSLVTKLYWLVNEMKQLGQVSYEVENYFYERPARALFHWQLRNEIAFNLIPTSYRSGDHQAFQTYACLRALQAPGLFHKSGFEKLSSVRKLFELLQLQVPRFSFKTYNLNWRFDFAVVKKLMGGDWGKELGFEGGLPCNPIVDIINNQGAVHAVAIAKIVCNSEETTVTFMAIDCDNSNGTNIKYKFNGSELVCTKFGEEKEFRINSERKGNINCMPCHYIRFD